MSVSPIAKVDNQKVQFQDFYREYHNALNNVSRKMNGQIPKNILDELPNMVAQDLVNKTVIEKEMEKVGIITSKKLIEDYIRSFPEFQKDGVFDAELFQNTLVRAGINAHSFVSDISKQLKQQQFFYPLISGAKLNDSYVNLLLNTVKSKKVFEIAFIPKNIIKTSKPKDKDLEKYLKENAIEYNIPEERDVELFVLDHEALRNSISVSEDELKEGIEEYKKTLIVNEKKIIKKFISKTESDAESVKQSLLGNKTLSDVAKQNKDSTMESVSDNEQNNLPEDIRETIFSLKKGESFGPILIDGKYIIYVIEDIIPQSVKEYNESDLKKEVEQDIKSKKVVEILESTKNNIEDAFASGEEVSTILQKFPLKQINANNISLDNGAKILAGHGISQDITGNIVSNIFELEEGSDTPFIDFEGSSVIIKLKKINQQHLPEINDIRNQLEKDWTKAQTQKAEFEWFSNNFSDTQDDPSLWQNTVKKFGCSTKEFSISSLDIFLGEADESLFDSGTLNGLMLLRKHKIEFKQLKDESVVAVFVKDVKQDLFGSLNEKKIKAEGELKSRIVNGASRDLMELSKNSVKAVHKVKINQKSIDKVRSMSNNDE